MTNPYIVHPLVPNLIRTFSSEGRQCGYAATATALRHCVAKMYYMYLPVRTIRVVNLTCYTTLWFDFRGKQAASLVCNDCGSWLVIKVRAQIHYVPLIAAIISVGGSAYEEMLQCFIA
jgi:hypothetical protein